MLKVSNSDYLQRDRYQIFYDILKHLEDGGQHKTRLMQLAFLSWSKLNDELSAMDKLQLVSRENEFDKTLYITERGQKFIEKYDSLMRIFDTKKI